MSIKSYLGLDGFDVFLHGAVTVVFLLLIAATNREQDAQIGIGVVTAASLVIFGIRRRFALRRMGTGELTTGEVAAERLAELEMRMADLEQAQARIAELEDRLDFAERLLTKAASEPAAVRGGDGR